MTTGADLPAPARNPRGTMETAASPAGGETAGTSRPIAGLLPLVAGAVIFLVLILAGANLLNDPDTYWHIATAEWIFANGFPTTDSFSSTYAGEPWIAKEWLSQVLYALAFRLGGWTGVVALAAAAFAATIALLARALERTLASIEVITCLCAAFMLAAPHVVARPHLLVLPVVLCWTAGLVRALDGDGKPPFLILPLMTLWANLHGSFLLGLLLAGAAALESLVAAAPGTRRKVFAAWSLFGIAAVAAACVTPYGLGTAAAALDVLRLGDLLPAVDEFRPPDFSKPSPLEFILLAAIGVAVWRGVRLPPVRILVILGLVHLALSGERYAETLGLLAPLYLAAPLARQFPEMASKAPKARADGRSVIAGLVLLAVAAVAVAGFARTDPSPNARISPVAAVAAIKAANVGPVLNDYDFGGYMIAARLPTFVDGRAELYGETFLLRYRNAVLLSDLAGLIRILDEYGIRATLFSPAIPIVAWLDREPGWKRLYADGIAVVHVRTGEAAPN